ncbi:sulfotransferase 1C2-like [Babylonia areolata]|uniref:sulfotransferase 1C2-like n=1 Tax=Babylonia areolata TaxID=304850 RepID=UPI003FD68A4D
MASDEFLALDISKTRKAVYEGTLLPEQDYEPVSIHMPKVKAMEIRDDDIILCSFPKSGTHWLFRILDMIQRGQAEYSSRSADSTFIDLQDVDSMAQLRSPRVLLTHLNFQHFPAQAKDKRTKVVHVYRNPRSVLVSFYFQAQGGDLGRMMGDDEFTMDKAVATFFSPEKMFYDGWLNFMDQIRAYKEENPEHPILDVSYEDMTQNPEDTVTRLGQFLGRPVSGQLCADIVSACRFRTQKAREEAADPTQADFRIYRKGDMDDWKNHVTVALDEKFQHLLQERAERCPYSARYCQH